MCFFNRTNRAIPDISIVGSRIATILNGDMIVMGGTSASTPIVAGIFTYLTALARAIDGQPLGNVNALIYQLHESDPTMFNDVKDGRNDCTQDPNNCAREGCYDNPKPYSCEHCNGFLAGEGWDPVTGLGTPNVGRLQFGIAKFLCHPSRNYSELTPWGRNCLCPAFMLYFNSTYTAEELQQYSETPFDEENIAICFE